jgi:hypothetical protein
MPARMGRRLFPRTKAFYPGLNGEFKGIIYYGTKNHLSIKSDTLNKILKSFLT